MKSSDKEIVGYRVKVGFDYVDRSWTSDYPTRVDYRPKLLLKHEASKLLADWVDHAGDGERSRLVRVTRKPKPATLRQVQDAADDLINSLRRASQVVSRLKRDAAQVMEDYQELNS